MDLPFLVQNCYQLTFSNRLFSSNALTFNSSLNTSNQDTNALALEKYKLFIVDMSFFICLFSLLAINWLRWESGLHYRMCHKIVHTLPSSFLFPIHNQQFYIVKSLIAIYQCTKKIKMKSVMRPWKAQFKKNDLVPKGSFPIECLSTDKIWRRHFFSVTRRAKIDQYFAAESKIKQTLQGYK